MKPERFKTPFPMGKGVLFILYISIARKALRQPVRKTRLIIEIKCRRLTIEGFPEKRRPVLSRAAKGKPVPPQYAPCEAEAGTSGIAQCRRQWTQATFP